MSRTFIAAFAIVAISVMSGCGGGDEKRQPGGVDPAAVVARVNGAEIRAGSVEAQYAVALRTFRGAKRVVADEEGRAAVRAQMLGGLIQLRLLEQAATENGITVEAGDVRKQRQTMITASGGGTAYAKRVRGIPAPIVEQQLRQAVLEDELIATLARDATVPESELRAFFRTNRGTRFGPAVEARHILVASRRAADAVLERLAAGEGFAAVAADVSLDAATAASGGRLGAIRRGATLAPITDAALSTALGQHVAVRTELGVHVLEVTDRQRAPTYAEVQTEIRAELTRGVGLQRLARLIGRRAAKADVWVNEAYGRWNPAQAIVLPTTGE